MEERRRSKRTELNHSIVINRLGSDMTEDVNIDVVDVSKTGVGFTCNQPLEIGAIYETFLTIWTKEIIHAFVEIVRIEKKDDTFHYGGIFIGMPEMDSARIQVYQTIEEIK